MKIARDHLAVALDVKTPDEAYDLARAVSHHAGVVKIGLELFIAAGPSVVSAFSGGAQKVFLDLKLHDIPETVERAISRAAHVGAAFLTIHAHGGRAMMTAAARAAEGSGLRLLAVTVLTSHSSATLSEINVTRSPEEHALDLAKLAADCGVTGLVASPLEAARIRAALPDAFIVTPGIRPTLGALLKNDDQTRIATPSAAIKAGASLLVVGRPIRDADDRAAAARAIPEEVAAALE